MDLLELAARVEAAEGHPGNHSFRELDLDILLAIEPEHEARLMPRAGQPNPQPGTTWEWTAGGVAWTKRASFATIPVPFFTRSLDAAMTLVPEGMEWFRERGKYVPFIVSVDGPTCRYISECDSSLALALCAAALRARAA